MMGLRPIKMPSAKERVAAELRKAILSRQMKEGEVLSLESVASQLNVSAMPVREAFQILARDGLIQLRKNKAAVVLGVTETYIKEHYQLRAILEGAAARLCAAPETDISELEEIYQDSCKILENKDFSRYTDINREFHNEICMDISEQDLSFWIQSPLHSYCIYEASPVVFFPAFPHYRSFHIPFSFSLDRKQHYHHNLYNGKTWGLLCFL